MQTAEDERLMRIYRIMWDHNITYRQAEPVADAEIRFEERKAKLTYQVMKMAKRIVKGDD